MRRPPLERRLNPMKHFTRAPGGFDPVDSFLGLILFMKNVFDR
jgi:hypothetical protein